MASLQLKIVLRHIDRGAGTSLNVGATSPAQKWGYRSSAKRRKIFFGRAPPLFGSKSTISRFGERFRDDQYSFGQLLVCCFYSRCPFVKVGGTCSPCPMESAPRATAYRT